MSRLPRAGAVLAACLSTACGASRLTLPAGPGAPAPDAVDAFTQSTARCQSITSFSAELAVSGRANDQRLRGRVLAGLAAPSSALLDAAAPFGASLFIYAARDAQVTLLLPRDRRVLRHDDPAAVLEAVTGVPLSAGDLRRTLTGCPAEGRAANGRAFGAAWRVVTLPDGEAYLRRASAGGSWRLVAVTRGPGSDGWRADYSDFAVEGPRTIRLVSADDGRRFDLRLALSQIEVNPRLGPEVFEIRVPDSASPISLSELRLEGPLGERR